MTNTFSNNTELYSKKRKREDDENSRKRPRLTSSDDSISDASSDSSEEERISISSNNDEQINAPQEEISISNDEQTNAPQEEVITSDNNEEVNVSQDEVITSDNEEANVSQDEPNSNAPMSEEEASSNNDEQINALQEEVSSSNSGVQSITLAQVLSYFSQFGPIIDRAPSNSNRSIPAPVPVPALGSVPAPPVATNNSGPVVDSISSGSIPAYAPIPGLTGGPVGGGPVEASSIQDDPIRVGVDEAVARYLEAHRIGDEEAMNIARYDARLLREQAVTRLSANEDRDGEGYESPATIRSRNSLEDIDRLLHRSYRFCIRKPRFF